MDEKVKEIGNLLKSRLREFKIGGCKVISKGDNCDCSLCLVDKLLSYIKELEEEKKGMVRLSEADMKKLGWSYT